MRKSSSATLLLLVSLCACSSREDPNAGKEVHSFENQSLSPLEATDNIQLDPPSDIRGAHGENLETHVYDVSMWQELWGKYGKNREYETIMPLFLMRDEFQIYSPMLTSPGGYNHYHRNYDAPKNAEEYKPEEWPNILGVVDAKTKIRTSRVLLFGAAGVQESFQLLVEAEILDGAWKGTRVMITLSEFATFEDLPNASFRLADIGVIRTNLHVFGPDGQFLREVPTK